MAHIPIQTIERFAHRTLDPADLWPVVDHLLQGCPQCLARLHVVADRLEAASPPFDLVPGPKPPTSPGTHLRAVARALSSVPRWHQEELFRDRYRERAATEKGMRQMLQGSHPVAAVEILLERSFAERYKNPGKMLQLAELAADYSIGLEEVVLGLTQVADLKSRIWGKLANACRVNLKFPQAAESFAKAWAFWAEGSRSPLLEARLYDLEASFASSRRELALALVWLMFAEAVYTDLGDTHQVGRILIKQGINTFYDGREAQAVSLFQEGLSRIDKSRDPQLDAQAKVNLLNALATSGQYHEAAKYLLESGLRQALAGDISNTAHLQWIEGKILAGLGKRHKAIREMKRALETFEDRQEVYDAALLKLELAGVWLELREWATVKELAGEARITLIKLEISAEASKAVLLLEMACQDETATVSLVRRVLRFLRLAQWYPEQKFA